MPHKDPKERAKYFREWRSGSKRKDAKLKREAAEQIAKYAVSDCGVRAQAQIKELKRQQRAEARQELCEKLRKEIARLSVNPFSRMVKS